MGIFMMKTIVQLKTAFLFLCLMFLLGCQGDKADQLSGENSRISVTAAQIETMDVHHYLKQTGTLLANETVLVKSEAQGKIKEICFEEGTKAGKGDILVKIEDVKLRAETKRLKAQIEQYKVQLANTEKTLKRKRRLLKGAVVPEQEFDDLAAQQGIEKAIIKQVQANLIIAQEKLDDTEIRSPFDGITSERLVSVGDYIAVGDPIVTVVQVDPLKVSIRIFEKFKEKIHIGMPAEVTVEAFHGEVFVGSVYFISPDVDVKTRTFLMKAIVPNPDNRLNPGMFANISIEYEKHKDAIIVPWEAVVQLEDRAFVFTIVENKAHQVPVTVLKVFDDKAEVAGSLTPGQQVILEGKFTVEEGDMVVVQDKQ
jgi:membrane fusion protein (multidrug efflux system)